VELAKSLKRLEEVIEHGTAPATLRGPGCREISWEEARGEAERLLKDPIARASLARNDADIFIST
jgi:hypothetical protein